MSGFEQLESALQRQSVATVKAEDLAFPGETMDDQFALDLVLNDVHAAANYFNQYVKTAMDEAERLYKGAVKQTKWSNGKLRSALSMPVVLDATEKLVAILHTTLWSGRRPFSVVPTGKTSEGAAEALNSILKWAVDVSKLEEKMRIVLKSCLQFGYCLGEWGWETLPDRKRVYSDGENGEITSTFKTIKLSQPFFRNLDLHKSYIDPKLNVQDPREGDFYVKQAYLTGYDLHALRGNPNFKDIPSDDEIKEIVAARGEPTRDELSGQQSQRQPLQALPQTEEVSGDPLLHSFEYLEYWRDDRVIGVLQAGAGGIVIRNQENEFGKKCCVGTAFIDVINSAHGYGTGRLLSGEQAIQTGTVNTWMDSQALILNPIFQLLKGTGIAAQSIEVFPGKIVNAPGDLKQIEVQSTTNEAMNIIEASQDRAFRRVAANGGMDLTPSALRTSGGVATVQGDVTTRLQYFLNIFINLVFVPVLDAFLQMACQKLTRAEMQAIITQDLGKEFEGNLLDVYNGTYRVEIIAGSKLTSREATGQMAPTIMQMLMAAPVQDSLAVQGMKWDYVAFIRDMLDNLGWDAETFVKEMSPDDVKRYQQQQQSAGMQQKAEMALQLEQLQQQGAMALQTLKGDITMASTALKGALKGHNDAALNEMKQAEQEGQEGEGVNGQ